MNYIEIDKQGKEEMKVRRVASQVITWKKHASAEFIQKEPQLVKNFSKSREHHEHILHKRLSVEDPQVNLKEWREKVVRVLRKEDRRKRKVTFR